MNPLPTYISTPTNEFDKSLNRINISSRKICFLFDSLCDWFHIFHHVTWATSNHQPRCRYGTKEEEHRMTCHSIYLASFRVFRLLFIIIPIFFSPCFGRRRMLVALTCECVNRSARSQCKKITVWHQHNGKFCII